MRTIRTTIIGSLVLGLLAGTAVGAAAQDEATEPTTTSFTGRFTDQVDQLSPPMPPNFLVDQVEFVDDFAFRSSVVSSDPRLTGRTLYTGDWLIDQARTTDSGRVTMLKAAVWELTNAGGSWIGESVGFGDVDAGINVETIVFTGRGGYEGLTAVLMIESPSNTFRGTIFPLPMPEAPELYSAE